MKHFLVAGVMAAATFASAALPAVAAEFTMKVGYSNREDPKHPA